jgi:heme A synthase
MYEFIQKFHSGWAYLALLLLIVAVVISFSECLKEFTAKNRKIALFALIAIHVQLLVGIILYFVSPNGFSMIKAVGMGGLTTESRLLALEHPLNNIAIALTL